MSMRLLDAGWHDPSIVYSILSIAYSVFTFSLSIELVSSGVLLRLLSSVNTPLPTGVPSLHVPLTAVSKSCSFVRSK